MTGKKLLSIQPTKFIGQFVHPIGEEGSVLKGWIRQPAASLTLLEYMIIWCRIQVIINPFQDLNEVATDSHLLEQSAGTAGEVQVQQSGSGSGQEQVQTGQTANFGYPGNYLFPSNIEATMEKVQVRIFS